MDCTVSHSVSFIIVIIEEALGSFRLQELKLSVFIRHICHYL
jgi:hypothetical protein